MRRISLWFFLAAILIFSLIVSRDLFQPGYFSMHDDLQIGRLYQMDLCFKDGQFPCRWVPDMGFSYGYPLFNYYPPLPYYLGELVHLLGFSLIDSVKFIFFTGFLISGILMFFFTRRLWGDWGGLLSATLYLLAPYHSVDVYVRGAMNEFYALAFLPGVAWAIYEIVDQKKVRVKEVSWLAILFGCLLLSHNLMAFIFAPGLAAFALLLVWLKKRSFREKLSNLAAGGLWGLGLAAFFSLPVLLEKKYVHVETMLMGYFNYLAHYVPIGKMLFTRYWGYGSSGWLQETGMPFQVGFPHWPLALAVTLIFSVLFLRKKIALEKLALVIFSFFSFLSYLFLIHLRSNFIWQKVPLLAYLQFPWRFLTLVIFNLSVAGGAVVLVTKNERLKVFMSFILVISTVLLNFGFFRVEKIISINDEEKLFSPLGQIKLQTDAIFDYLPIFAKAPPASTAPKKPQVVKGEAFIEQVEKGTDWYRFTALVSEASLMEIPLYDFPGWEVRVDGEKTAISHDNHLGLITVNLGQGEHLVEARLTDTPIRRAGNLISIASLGLLAVLNLRKISLKTPKLAIIKGKEKKKFKAKK